MSRECTNCQNLIQTAHPRIMREGKVYHMNKQDCVKKSFIGKHLREMREARKLSAHDIAYHMGVTQWEVYGTERSIVSEETFKKYSNAIREANKAPAGSRSESSHHRKKRKVNTKRLDKSAADKLVKIRYDLGLSIKDFSAKLGISRATLTRYEMGQFGIPAATMKKAESLVCKVVEKFDEQYYTDPAVKESNNLTYMGPTPANPDQMYKMEYHKSGYAFVPVTENLAKVKAELQEYKEKFEALKKLVGG